MFELSALTLLEIILIIGFGLTFFVELFYWLYIMLGIWRHRQHVKAGKVAYREDQPGVSVIICARNEGRNLLNYLPAVLEQRYPTFEVIVIDDGSIDNTHDVITIYSQKYSNLHITFVPREARALSSKKLAITLGVKAARYDYLLFTDADCVPESDLWIAMMMRNFTDDTDFVLGYGAYFEDKTHLSRLISFDTLTIGMQYLGYAEIGIPYMGVGRNMAYRKRVFMDNRGFAGMLGVIAGDDDLFVNRYATGKGTRIEVTPESVIWSPAKKRHSSWWQQKRRHLSVSPLYTATSKFIAGWECVVRFFFYATFLCMLYVSKWPFIMVAMLCMLIKLLTEESVINRTARQLGQHRFALWNVLYFDIVIPVVNLIAMLTPRRHNGW
ncbi:MAG TPA: glycosyl transferase family 2 [Bacteroidales bacterium]|nr:glycosyl transferase family 2 [Bacteroidales bacterium]